MNRPDVLYNYVEDVDPNLTCSICCSALVDPVTTASCKHTFCRDCITCALKHNPSCPIDRSALAVSSLRDTEPLVQLMLDELQVRCEAEGCGKIMQRGLLLSHIRSCTRAIVTCGDGDCGLSMARHRMPHHRAYECFQRRMACTKCGITLTFKEAKEGEHSAHTTTCGPTCEDACADACEFCGEHISAGVPPAMHRWTCVAAPVSCSHTDRGCSAIVPRSELESHLSTCPFEAMSAFFAANDARFAVLERKCDEVRAENEGLRSQIWGMRRGLIVPRRLWSDELSAINFGQVPTGAVSAATQAAAPLQLSPSSTSTVPVPPRATVLDLTHDPEGTPTASSSVLPNAPMAAPLADAAQDEDRHAPDTSPSTSTLSEFTTTADERPLQQNNAQSASYTDWVLGRLPPAASFPTDGDQALRAAVIHIAAGLDAAVRRSEVRITTETLRILEEVATLRAIVRPMRMQVLSDRPGSPQVNRFPLYTHAHAHSAHAAEMLLPTPPMSTSAPSLANDTPSRSSIDASSSSDDDELARTSIRESVVFSALGAGHPPTAHGRMRSSSSSLVGTATGSGTTSGTSGSGYRATLPREWTGRPCAFPPAPPEPPRTSRLSSLGASIFRGMRDGSGSGRDR